MPVPVGLALCSLGERFAGIFVPVSSHLALQLAGLVISIRNSGAPKREGLEESLMNLIKKNITV